MAFLSSSLASAAGPLDPFLAPGLSLSGATDLVGGTAGTFDVGSSGSATYRIPLTLPPGTAGMAPGLALVYDSQGVDGLVGMGWSLGGTSAVTRCAKTLVPDGVLHVVDFTVDDPFCIDGQRLIPVGDGSYRTQIDSFMKVVPSGGTASNPQTFTAYTKEGRVLEFGGTADSRIEAQGRSDVLAWALDRVQDRAGNYFTITYGEVNAQGFSAPLRMDYTGNTAAALSPYNSVLFHYENRPDVVQAYVGGSLTSLPVRLKQIETYAGTTPVRAYLLNYQVGTATSRSRLTSVYECGFQSGTPACLPATSFTWQEGTKSFQAPTQWLASNGGPSGADTFSHADPLRQQVADFNGDGRADYLYQNNGWYVAVSTGTGLAAPALWLASNGGPSGADTSSGTMLPRQEFYGDFTGDGRTDYLYKNNGWYVARATDTGFAAPALWLASNGGPNGADAFSHANPLREYVADFTGDGRVDYLYQNGGWYVAVSTGTGFAAPALWLASNGGPNGADTSSGDTPPRQEFYGDFNGDGRTDYLYKNNGWYVALSTGSGFATPTLWLASNGGPPGATNTYSTSNPLHEYLGDFNGDGRTDYLYKNNGWYVALSTGTAFTAPTQWLAGNGGPGGSATVSDGTPRREYVTDFNGDGRADYLYNNDDANNTGDWYVSLSLGNTFAAPTLWLAKNGGPPGASNTHSTGTPRHEYLGDFNGDGRTDYLYKNNGWWVARAGGAAPDKSPDLLHEVVDGVGADTQIFYEPLTNPLIYTKGSGAAYPLIDMQTSQAVVAGVRSSNGLGGLTERDFQYSQLRRDVQRGLSLGFLTVVESDEARGTTTTTSYNQSFPIQGTQSQLELRTDSDNKLRMRTTSTVTSSSAGTGASTIWRFFVSQNVDQFFEANGTTLTVSRTTTSQVDAFNNPTVVTSGSNDGYGKTTTTTYTNNTSAWLIGLPTQVQVVGSAPGVPQITRTIANTFDSVTGLRTQETLQPATSLAVTRTFTRDGFGNVIATSVSGSGFATRSESATFDSRGLFPVSATNALAQIETRTFDGRFGAVLSVRDINALNTALTYDALGRELTRTNPDGTVDTVVRDWCDTSADLCPDVAVISVGTLRDGSPPQYRDTDVLGREVRRSTVGFNGTTVAVDTVYDAMGHLQQNSLPYFQGTPPSWTQFTYDGLDRVLTRTAPDGSVTTYAYSGLATAVVNALGQTETTLKNSQDQIVRVTDALNHSNQYVYDAFGNLLSVTDSQNHVTSATYDALGRRLTLNDPDLGLTTTTYDALGEVLTETDAKSQVRSFSYDRRGRPTQRTEADGQSTFTYDSALHGVGALASVAGTTAGKSFSKTFSYDTAGRPSSTTVSVDSRTYTTTTQYDSFGRVSGLVYPTGFAVQKVFNAAGYLAQVKNASSGAVYWTGEARNAAGQLTQDLLGNNLRTQRTFDPLTQRLGQIRTGTGTGSAVQNLTYTWNVLGNLTQRADLNRSLTENFQYDAMNRLTQSQVVGQSAITFSYDAGGNLLSKSDVGTYTYGSAAHVHAVTATTGPLTRNYSYDANGNQTGRTDSGGTGVATLNYTSFDKPSFISMAMATGVQVSEFRYDEARALLVRKDTPPSGPTATTYFVGGGLFEEMVPSSGPTQQRHYIPGGDAVIAVYATSSAAPSTLRYLHRDHLGSMDVITDGGGLILETLSYDAFGRRRNAANWTSAPINSPLTSGLTKGFTGHEELDNLGLVHMGGRVYDPALGRFTSPDPFVQFPDSTQGFNRYTYVHNNPLSHVDHSGFGFFDFLKKVVNIVATIYRVVSEIVTVATVCVGTGGTACAGAISYAVSYELALNVGPSLIYGNNVPRAVQAGERISGYLKAFDAAKPSSSGSTKVVGIGSDIEVRLPSTLQQWLGAKSGATIRNVDGGPGQVTDEEARANLNQAYGDILKAIRAGELDFLEIDESKLQPSEAYRNSFRGRIFNFLRSYNWRDGFDLVTPKLIPSFEGEPTLAARTEADTYYGGTEIRPGSMTFAYLGVRNLREAYRTVGHEFRHLSLNNARKSNTIPPGGGPMDSEIEKDASSFEDSVAEHFRGRW